jgi:hypothetical protein
LARWTCSRSGGQHIIRTWRWGVVLGAAALLAALPPVIGGLPAAESGLGAAELLRKIAGSENVSYQGVAESDARFQFPDFRRAQRLIEMFGEKTSMRVWRLDEVRWRVDEINPISERDTYSDESGLWVWNSGSRHATRIEGHADVRFARAADLVPSELGRRLAAAAVPDEAARLPARRIAGVHAAGLRLTPRSPTTTVERVDVWADPGTGVPVAVEITPRGGDVMISSQFLDIDFTRPARDVVAFELPDDATHNHAEVEDFASAVDRYSPFLLPDQLSSLSRRTSIARAAATYGSGFDLVATLVLRQRFAPFRSDELEQIPEVKGEFGTGRLLETPLLNGLYVEWAGVVYMVAGTVTPDVLQEVAEDLAKDIQSRFFRGLQ